LRELVAYIVELAWQEIFFQEIIVAVALAINSEVREGLCSYLRSKVMAA